MKVYTLTHSVRSALLRDGFAWEAGQDGGLWVPVAKEPSFWARLWAGWKRRYKMAKLEHVNLTVKDPKSTAELLCRLFDWRIRWEGRAIAGGYTIHVGDEDGYLAIYTPKETTQAGGDTYHQRGGLNHIGIVVQDLDMIEERVKAAGFHPHNHADYEPGQRFYFDGPDGVEYEVVSYA